MICFVCAQLCGFRMHPLPYLLLYFHTVQTLHRISPHETVSLNVHSIFRRVLEVYDLKQQPITDFLKGIHAIILLDTI
jgi:hypothetical protein